MVDKISAASARPAKLRSPARDVDGEAPTAIDPKLKPELIPQDVFDRWDKNKNEAQGNKVKRPTASGRTVKPGKRRTSQRPVKGIKNQDGPIFGKKGSKEKRPTG
jgi:hypothetical protein